MHRRQWLAATTGWAGAAGWIRPARAAEPRTLRVAFQTAEAGFDPPQLSDSTSLRILAHIVETLYTYDHLARPALLVPQTAAGMPEVSADFRRHVFSVRPGIHFADDPAFAGRPRELVAADCVYSIKRYYDPKVVTEHLYQWENAKLLGLSELRREALKSRTPFPYDADVPGLRVLDRYRFEVRLADPAPRFAALFAIPQVSGIVAREVIEAYPDPMAHPVGTGPFMLSAWRRSSRIVLVRNPRFREQIYASRAPADDPDAQAVAAALRGRTLPLVDRIEIDIVEESQPRWLAFLRGEHDVLTLPVEFGRQAMPQGRLAPFLVKRGVTAHRYVQAGTAHTYFNIDDPMVGGNAPAQVALRRAVALAWDSGLEIRSVLQDQAIPAQTMIPPHCYGNDPGLVSEMSQASLARANALLDTWGYADRDGDGMREKPDGSPLALRIAFAPTQRGRAQSELWAKRLNAAGIRVQFEVAPFAELIKRALAGRLMMWGYIWLATDPDGDFYLGMAYGPNAGQSNDARFRLPALDRLYERQRVLPDGPERLQLMRDASRLMLAYVPYIPMNHPVTTDLMQPGVAGHRRHPFVGGEWRYTMIGTQP